MGAARVRHEGEHVDAGMDGGREEHEQTWGDDEDEDEDEDEDGERDENREA